MGTKFVNAEKMLIDAYTQFKKKNPKITITHLAADVGLAYSTIYNPLFEGRKCCADVWLTLMNHFGCIKIQRSNVKIKCF